MTSPRPETTDRSEQPEERPQGVQLSATQVAAGALAAVSSAVVASFFGLAGTLVGAALASVISTVSAALYSSSLQRTNQRLQRARGQLTGRHARVVDEPDAAPATRVLPARIDPRHAPAPRRRPRWTRVAAYAAAVFVMAMGIVTGIELIGQKPVSALVGATETARTTTIGAITTASSSEEESEESEESDPSMPSSPTTTAPATGTGAPVTPTDDGSTVEDEESGSDGSEPATPTTSSGSGRATGSEPTDSSGDPSEESPGSAPAPGAGAEPTP
ncbi:hypothetical protein E4P41_01235 [Geodermatophilus sp. DF01-2]|uniref:hypothetical protein n=1 Tax=Geodermatophilus sp. DF01-2 TaxID=2559610 RepID=UPI00107387D2|nr:hypothetical protein [Geodermatophilus sp. DF01_2]TFV64525.1 hypothetical protein E4P41_01235 [Geodermatophilus sp. DF01_2]